VNVGDTETCDVQAFDTQNNFFTSLEGSVANFFFSAIFCHPFSLFPLPLLAFRSYGTLHLITSFAAYLSSKPMSTCQSLGID
jgi:hypothetical protein